MGLKSIFIFAFFVFSISLLHADYNFEQDKKKQLEYIKEDIFSLQSTIDYFQTQTLFLNEQINQINDSLNYLTQILQLAENKSIFNDSLFKQETELASYYKKMSNLKESFREKILWLYKHGSTYETEILFTSKNINEFYTRLAYLNKISALRKTDLQNIRINSYLLDEKKKLYGLNRRSKISYISQKEAAERTLFDRKLLLQQQIDSLGNLQEAADRQLDKKKRDLNALQTVINNLTSNFIYSIDEIVSYTNEPFSSLKGNLILPVESVNITEDFGNAVNPSTLTVTYNNGIDVSIARGSPVKAAAKGIVVKIVSLPYLGNTIVVDHGEGFYTVYSILSSAYKKTGESVSAGEVIALTGENNKGQLFHFELWHNNIPQDPKFWVKH